MDAAKVVLGVMTVIGLLADLLSDDDWAFSKVNLFGQCKYIAQTCPKRSICNK